MATYTLTIKLETLTLYIFMRFLCVKRLHILKKEDNV